MAQNYRYISGDSHLEIDAKWWVGRVPTKYRDQAPRLVRLPDGSDAWAIEGNPCARFPLISMVVSREISHAQLTIPLRLAA